MGRQSFDMSTKLRTVERIRAGNLSIRQAARENTTSPCAIRGWLRRASEITKHKVVRASAKRLVGGGAKPKYPVVEVFLLNLFKQLRSQKLPVHYNTLRRAVFAKSAELGISGTSFACSDSYIRRWSKRHRVSARSVTHRGQQCRASLEEQRATIREFQQRVANAVKTIPADRLMNCDQTPVWLDCNVGSTLDFTGEKSVEVGDVQFKLSSNTYLPYV